MSKPKQFGIVTLLVVCLAGILYASLTTSTEPAKQAASALHREVLVGESLEEEVTKPTAITSPLREAVPNMISDVVSPSEDAASEIVALQDENRRLQSELSRMRNELELCEYPEDTTWGAFIRSDDNAIVSDLEERAWLHDMFDALPVDYIPGDASMLVGRVYLNDSVGIWIEGCIEVLGSWRIQRDLSESELKELATILGEDSCLQYFGSSVASTYFP